MSMVSRSVRRSLMLAALLLSLVALSPARALASGWSAIAATCTPDDNTVKYDFRGAVFQFKSWALSTQNWRGIVLPITARCNVSNPLIGGNPHWQRLVVSYQDPDGPGPTSKVVARLVRTSRPSGFEIIATFDSNAYASTGAVFADESVSFNSASLDFSDADYFVEVHLYRATLASNPRVLRVRLDE